MSGTCARFTSTYASRTPPARCWSTSRGCETGWLSLPRSRPAASSHPKRLEQEPPQTSEPLRRSIESNAGDRFGDAFLPKNLVANRDGWWQPWSAARPPCRLAIGSESETHLRWLPLRTPEVPRNNHHRG